jgi:hypothetical protein
MQMRRFRFAISRYDGLWLKDRWRYHPTVLYYNVKVPHLLANFLQANNRTERPEQKI